MHLKLVLKHFNVVFLILILSHRVAHGVQRLLCTLKVKTNVNCKEIAHGSLVQHCFQCKTYIFPHIFELLKSQKQIKQMKKIKFRGCTLKSNSIYIDFA